MKRIKKSHNAMYVRSFVFGVEDSLVSTVGLLSGVAAGGVAPKTVILTGVVLIFVEALSMGIGNFLSEHSAEEYTTRKKASNLQSAKAGITMFISYLLSGFIPLLPYILFPVATAFWMSIMCSLAALYILGAISAKLAHISIYSNALKTFLLGGFAIAVGVLVGQLTKAYL